MSQDQIEMIRSTEKGDLSISVEVIDENNIEPLVCEAIWAWIPKNKK